MVRTMGARAIGRLGRVCRSPPVFRLPPASPHGHHSAAGGMGQLADFVFHGYDIGHTSVSGAEWKPAYHRGDFRHGLDLMFAHAAAFEDKAPVCLGCRGRGAIGVHATDVELPWGWLGSGAAERPDENGPTPGLPTCGR